MSPMTGVLHVDISQQKAARAAAGERRGFVRHGGGLCLRRAAASSLYVPVVTGSYRPPFPAAYEGPVRAHIDIESAKVDKRIAELEREKYPLYRRELQNDRNLSALRRMRVKKQWWRLESSAEFDKRVGELRRHKVEMRRKYRYEARMIQQGIDRIARQQEAERLKQKKLEKSYEDFMKLLTFVEFVEEDDFWRSEVVQIAARTTPAERWRWSWCRGADATPFFSGASSRWSVSSTSCCASTATGCRTSAGMRTGR